jgi:hypothetical protein
MTSYWATSIGGDGTVVTAHYKSAAGNLVKCVSTIGTQLQHAAVETDIGINVRGFKVEVVPE